MTDKELWATFEKTGRITDYLQYRSLYGGEYKDCFINDKDQVREKDVGEKAVESDSNGNRHDTVRSTYRGI